MARIFLTNATGFIGEAVARAYKAKGHEVSAIARNEESKRKLEQAGITPIAGDLKQPETILAGAKNADVVIHTASTNDAEYGKYDNLAVEKIIEALRGTNKTFIYTSGVWVIGDTNGNAVTEQTPLNPIELVAWRVDVERKVLEATKDQIKSFVVRPSLVYGYNKGIVGKLAADAQKSGEVRFVGNGENRWATVHVEDLADAYVLTYENGKPGSVYNLSYGPSVRVKEVAENVAKALGLEGKTAGFPVELARVRLGLYADALALDQQIDSTKAQTELKWQPKRANVVEDIQQNGKQLTAAR